MFRKGRGGGRGGKPACPVKNNITLSAGWGGGGGGVTCAALDLQGKVHTVCVQHT